MLPIDYQLRMQELLSADEYDSFVNSLKAPEFRALRLNPLKVDRAQFPAFISGLKEALEKKGIEVSFEPVKWEECGYYYCGPAQYKPGNNVFHEAGAYYVQEPSAMKPVSLLDVSEGERILDLCAAPGSKSTQIAGYMQGSGLLVSNEIVRSRALTLSANIERMGVRNAIVLNETPARLSNTFVDYFDKILVDAPCSGEGMFRKNPAAMDEWSIDNVKMCASRQDEILDHAATMLKPSGTLIYSTCTFSREEDEECIERFLSRHPDYEKVSMEKLFPHRVKGEGHFMAKLKRSGKNSEGYCMGASRAGNKRVRNGKEAERLKLFDDFCNDALTCSLTGRRIFFGDNLYLLPEDAPDLDGLKVIRSGLQLGSFTGNREAKKGERFVPSHSLALALRPSEAENVVNITMDEAGCYIEGLTLEAPSPSKNSWCLMCCEGISLGWGRIAGGVIKNHYPKGLRMHL